MTASSLVSIVVPVRNEAEVLPFFLEQLTELISQIEEEGNSVEIIFNDNASLDDSLSILRSFSHSSAQIKIHPLARNYGFQESILFGIRSAQGDCVVVLQSDLQDPPSQVADMVHAWRRGALTVACKPITRDEKLLIGAARSSFYRMLAIGSGEDHARGILDFYLLDRVVVDDICQVPYQGLYIRGLIAQTYGFEVVLPYNRQPRTRGRSNFTWNDLYEMGMNGVLTHGKALIRGAAIGGFLVSVTSVVAILVLALLWITGMRVEVSGWLSVVSLLLLLLGISSFSFAIAFEYLIRVSAALLRPTFPQTRSRDSLNGQTSVE